MTSIGERVATACSSRPVPGGPTLRDVLVRRDGITPTEVNWVVHRRLYPLRARLARNCRLLFGGDPFDAQSAFVGDLVEARSVCDVEVALQAYRWHPSQGSGAVAWLMGTRLDRRQVVRFFSATMGVPPGSPREGAGA